MNIRFFTLLCLIAALASSCKVARFIVYNFANINDHKKFPKRDIRKSGSPFYFTSSIDTSNHLYKVHTNFDSLIESSKTVAFLIIQNDSLKYERYFKKYDQSSIVSSFSMAKSVTSILIGRAIEDGFIQSVNEPITKYIPELSKNGFDSVTIEHLLQMTSGLKFNEGYYNPFGDAATFYYGTNLRKSISKMELEVPPGQRTEYVSGNTQLLGLILERALKGKTISAYLEEKIWMPLGMEYDASWSTDRRKNGLEKTFCCLNARARDFAKIGRLYLNKGNWNGKQLVPEEWVINSTKRDLSNGSAGYYQYQWWILNGTGDFMAQGILGQYIFVSPEKNLVIVRLGKNYGHVDWVDLFEEIKNAY